MIEQLTLLDALRAFGRMFNTLDDAPLNGLLADDFRYASQEVFREMDSAKEYREYLESKLNVIREGTCVVTAELAVLPAHGGMNCLLLTQRRVTSAVLLLKVTGQHIIQADMCTVVPHPREAVPSGEIPA
jgi:hypothetical protein